MGYTFLYLRPSGAHTTTADFYDQSTATARFESEPGGPIVKLWSTWSDSTNFYCPNLRIIIITRRKLKRNVIERSSGPKELPILRDSSVLVFFFSTRVAAIHWFECVMLCVLRWMDKSGKSMNKIKEKNLLCAVYCSNAVRSSSTDLSGPPSPSPLHSTPLHSNHFSRNIQVELL